MAPVHVTKVWDPKLVRVVILVVCMPTTSEIDCNHLNHSERHVGDYFLDWIWHIALGEMK